MFPKENPNSTKSTLPTKKDINEKNSKKLSMPVSTEVKDVIAKFDNADKPIIMPISSSLTYLNGTPADFTKIKISKSPEIIYDFKAVAEKAEINPFLKSKYWKKELNLNEHCNKKTPAIQGGLEVQSRATNCFEDNNNRHVSGYSMVQDVEFTEEKGVKVADNIKVFAINNKDALVERTVNDKNFNSVEHVCHIRIPLRLADKFWLPLQAEMKYEIENFETKSVVGRLFLEHLKERIEKIGKKVSKKNGKKLKGVILGPIEFGLIHYERKIDIDGDMYIAATYLS